MPRASPRSLLTVGRPLRFLSPLFHLSRWITGERDSASGTRTEVPKLGFHRAGREISHALLKRAYVFIFSDFVAALWIPGLNGGKKGDTFACFFARVLYIILSSSAPHLLPQIMQGGSPKPGSFFARQKQLQNFAAQPRLTTAPTTCRDG